MRGVNIFNIGCNQHKNIIVNGIFAFLDQVSIFRLARCSKTLYQMLKDYLPRAEVIEFFNWKFSYKNINTQWKYARKRHQSNDWCLGGCGKKRKPYKTNMATLISRKRNRPGKESLNICYDCIRKRGIYQGLNDDINILESAKRLRTGLIRRDPGDPFIDQVYAFELEETKRSARILDAKVGDVLIPICTPYDERERLPVLTVKEVRGSNWVDANILDKKYIMNDESWICSYTGQRWSYNSSNTELIYTKKE